MRWIFEETNFTKPVDFPSWRTAYAQALGDAAPSTTQIQCRHLFKHDFKLEQRRFVTMVVDHKNKRLMELVEGKSRAELTAAVLWGREGNYELTTFGGSPEAHDSRSRSTLWREPRFCFAQLQVMAWAHPLT